MTSTHQHINTSTLLAMAQAPGGQTSQPAANPLLTFGPLLIIFVIFYFLLIRPQKQQQKKTQQMLSNLHKGDSVVTRGGVHGKIAGIADNILTVEIADNVKVKMARDAIIHVTPSAE